ncbi:MAG: hypothetical protein P8Y71_23625, partial [Pseudolabrys sp.]
RARLPKENGEVKGRLLNEEQIDEVVTLLARNEVLFKITAFDLGLHSEEGAKAYKQKHGEEMMAKVGNFHESVRPEVQKASQEILDMSIPLYLQALTTFEVIHRLMGHMTMYFSQRRPHELGVISWIVDGKDPQAATRWENWWSNYAQGALATMSKGRPVPRLQEGDYSFYDKSYRSSGEGDGEGTDLKLLLKDIRFSAESEAGLELVDIVTNAVRRTLAGNLRKEGWQNIHKLMVHRNKDKYIQFVLFGQGEDVVLNAEYGARVREGFSEGGKSMLTPTNLRLIEEQQPAPGSANHP